LLEPGINIIVGDFGCMSALQMRKQDYIAHSDESCLRNHGSAFTSKLGIQAKRENGTEKLFRLWQLGRSLAEVHAQGPSEEGEGG